MNSGMTFRVLSVTLMFSASLAFTSALPKNIKIFSAQGVSEIEFDEVRFAETDVEIYDFSLLESVEYALSNNLSDNPEVARKQANERIDSNFEWLKTSLKSATNAYVLVDKFGISKFPAVVINDKFVIYGTTDPTEILRIWLSFQDLN